VQRASLVAVGSPTINGDAVEPIWEFLSSLATIKIRGKMGFAFGSYGWSGEASKLINQRMKDIKFNMPLEPFRVRFRPTNDDLQKAFEVGKQLGQKVKEMA
jgi:flavorubredoxin